LNRLIRFAAFATGVAVSYGLADLLFSWNPIAAAPYLAHRHEPVFRAVPAWLVGMVAEAANGWIAALAFGLVEPALHGSSLRRGALFGLVMWGFWVLSGTFSAYVWLNVPTTLAVTNMVFGLGKCLCLGGATAALFRALGLPREHRGAAPPP
jgi:hypothetical protein